MEDEITRQLFNVYAEQAVLGSLLIDSDAWHIPEVQSLSFSDFHSESNMQFFRAMREMHNNGQPIDGILIREKLGGNLAMLGEITQLMNAVPTALNCGEYARIVKKHAGERQLITALQNAVVAFHEDDGQMGAPILATLLACGIQDSVKEDATGGWRVRTLEDAYKLRAPLEYVVGGMFPIPSLSVVYGAPGCLKSMLLADMAVCVAAGIDWLPPLIDGNDTSRMVRQSPILWLDFDNGKRRTDERFEAIGKARDLSPDTPMKYISMPDPWLDMSDPASAAFLSNRVVEHQAQLVIIDNLGTICGGTDENSGDMIAVMSRLRRISEETDAAIIVIHHQRKSNGFKARAGETLRGHSSIEAALDLALLIEREEHSDAVTIRSTKVRGPDVYPFGAQFSYEHKPGTSELKHVKFYGLTIEDRRSDKAIQREILASLNGKSMKKGDLTTSVKEQLDGIGANRIRSQIEYLAAMGTLVCKVGERNAKSYSKA